MTVEGSIRSAFERVLSPPEVHALSNSELAARLAELAEFMVQLDDEAGRVAAIRAGGAHPVWQVRSKVLEMAARWMPLEAAHELILDATHDSLDVIAFQAIRLCGELQLSSAVPHLVRISGWPSKFTQTGYLRKPVGIGAALTKHALTRIMGSEDPAQLLAKEEEYLAPYRQLLRRQVDTASTDGMVLIPGSSTPIGAAETAPRYHFEYRDYVPAKMVDIPSFYIDHVPVTNAQYLEFASRIAALGHSSCHPDEPPGKDHWPSHARDPRFGGPDLPVTGVDWYDAYAYAAWRGKQLPTEHQWEKAARGSDGRAYPWGDEWRPELANSFETQFGTGLADLSAWEQCLRAVGPEFPKRPLWPVGSKPEGDSPYGVADLAGNVWEWTRTNFHTREAMDPFFRGRRPLEFTNRRDAFPVIRGGCWTSLPEMLQTFYRGKDLLTDRHFEIGFRCVFEPAQNP